MRHTQKNQLKRGWTTGACACAAAKACLLSIILQKKMTQVTIDLPKNHDVLFLMKESSFDKEEATCTVIKDAGDDPDITHQAEIGVSLKKGKEGAGIRFIKGEGVGIVTMKGLPIAVGEPAITPKPRAYITQNMQNIIDTYNLKDDWDVTLFIKNGKELAKKTWNARLGIIDGLSILGTTGVVIPYSCSAWIHSIHRGIDLAIEQQVPMTGAATGKTSEDVIAQLYSLPEYAMLDMGDFIGGMVKYIVRHPIPHLAVGGGIAKMSKFALGANDLHSSRSSLDFKKLAHFLSNHLHEKECDSIAKSTSVGQFWQDFSHDTKKKYSDMIAKYSQSRLKESLVQTKIDIVLVDRNGHLLSHLKDGRKALHQNKSL